MSTAVRDRLTEVLGEKRPFTVVALPLRRWCVRIESMDRQRHIDLDLTTSEINMRDKALKRVLAPALERLRES